MKKQLLSLMILLWVVSNAQSQENQTLKKIFDNIKVYDGAYQLNTDLWSGNHPGEIEVPTWERMQSRRKRYKGYVKQLTSIKSSTLNRQDQISKAIKLMQLQDYLSGIQYKMALIPFNAEGGFFNNATFFMRRLPFKTKTDYENYLKWLPSYKKWLEGHQKLMERGVKEKIVAPQVIVKNVLKLLKPWIDTDYKKQPFYTPFLRFPSNISAADRNQLDQKVKAILQREIIPAYRSFHRFVETKYMKASPINVGVSNLPNGRAYYENRVKYYTTLDISPDSVFKIGQQEVKRIRGQMEQIIRQLKFKGTWADFFKFMRTDAQFFPKNSQELLSYAAWLSKKAEGQLPKFFKKLYSLPFTVAPVPTNIAPTYTSGRYVPGSRFANRPGTYWVNTYDLKSRTLYTLPALTLHESVPGHHLQITLATENRIKGNPDFRNNYYISAFGEGWGLYAEYLGEEMGIYTTPYEKFGRYTYEIWRACRLVVDVGMHYKGWNREKAVKFMGNNTALSLHEVNTEIDRYIAWPGQALSYKIGEITIKYLRQEAEKALGQKFDIQQFHEVILRNGSVPLPILREEVERYIEKNK
ncbi:hypothetical protein BKI52_22500 [marine bacterium AO1-C]|nr:hypothetical protein BKI52_22500 [marine bacterium AO1-C]